MFLYAWHPDSHGPYSFFVMAMNKEGAEKAVKEFIKNQGGSRYFNGSWPVDYNLEVFAPGEVAINNND